MAWLDLVWQLAYLPNAVVVVVAVWSTNCQPLISYILEDMMISLEQIFLCGVPLFLEYAGSQLSHSGN